MIRYDPLFSQDFQGFRISTRKRTLVTPKGFPEANLGKGRLALQQPGKGHHHEGKQNRKKRNTSRKAQETQGDQGMHAKRNKRRSKSRSLANATHVKEDRQRQAVPKSLSTS